MSGADTPWRRARAQVLVDDLEAPRLDDDVAHHLRRVLRLTPGSQVCAYDGKGSWVLGKLGSGDELEDLESRGTEPAPPHPLTVGFAALKGSRTELVVQKLTEIGVDSLWVLRTSRGVVRWDSQRADRQVERLRRVAIEACAQCRRLWLPTIEVLDFEDAIRAGAEGGATVLADSGGRELAATDRVVLIGPEGGWEDSERHAAESVTLGENVLRAETAAIVAGSAMTRLRSRPWLG